MWQCGLDRKLLEGSCELCNDKTSVFLKRRDSLSKVLFFFSQEGIYFIELVSLVAQKSYFGYP
jgi:hypothetical protein